MSTKDYRDREWDAYRNNRIGFVFQSYNLIPHQSVVQNVELALALSGVSRSERRERTLAALTRVGLADHVHKRPSQLSGGQMQRVAIARALVNDPEIVLADDPTGALDSATSVQVMDLLKEVASDRLVVMVTHNPDLAAEYATRIVELADGRIVSDSRPFDPAAEPGREAKPARRTSMSPLTALGLSARNLATKKGRPLMTAFAGSIGIIGIAANLALASGVDDYIARTEEDALTSYPLQINRTGIDMTAMMTGAGEESRTAPPRSGEAATRPAFSAMLDSSTSNDLVSLKAFLDADGGRIRDHVADIEYVYDSKPLVYQSDTTNGVVKVNPEQAFSTISSAYGSGAFSSLVQTDAFNQLPADSALYEDSYVVVAGHWPANDHELVLVLDSEGTMTDFLDYTLGLKPHSELDAAMEKYYSGAGLKRKGESGNDAAQSDSAQSGSDSFAYSQLLGRTFTTVPASSLYSYDEKYGVWTDRSGDSAFMKALLERGTSLEVAGIVKAKDSETTILKQGLGYTAGLTTETMEAAAASDIVRQKIAEPEVDVFTGRTFDELAKGEGGSGFDMSSLFTIDGSKLQAAFRFDPSALQADLSGLDFSALARGFIDYYAAHVEPNGGSAPDAGALASAYLATPEARAGLDEILRSGDLVDASALIASLGKALGEDPALAAVAKEASAQISAAIGRTIAEQMGSALSQQISRLLSDYMTTTMRSAMTAMSRSIAQAISGRMETAMTRLQASLATAMSIDESAFAEAFKANTNPEDLQKILATMMSTTPATYETNLGKLGWADPADPQRIDVSPTTFEDKDAVKAILDEYNADARAAGLDSRVAYTDVVGLLMNSVTRIIDIIKRMLIAFVSISLVVSSIMIAIITYISVLERKKEIGVLRSIGASKRDVSHVFNAETVIEGLLAGLMGVGATLVLAEIANAIVSARLGVDRIAQLPPAAGLDLVGVSVALTLIAGILLARGAVKADPVEALRSE